MKTWNNAKIPNRRTNSLVWALCSCHFCITETKSVRLLLQEVRTVTIVEDVIKCLLFPLNFKSRRFPKAVQTISCSSGCGMVVYCSQECREASVDSHGPECARFRCESVGTLRFFIDDKVRLILRIWLKLQVSKFIGVWLRKKSLWNITKIILHRS